MSTAASRRPAWECALTERVHPAMKGVEAAEAEAVLDRVGPEPERHQLRARDHAVLGLRELDKPPLPLTRRTFGAHFARFVRCVAHDGHRGAPGRYGWVASVTSCFFPR